MSANRQEYAALLVAMISAAQLCHASFTLLLPRLTFSGISGRQPVALDWFHDYIQISNKTKQKKRRERINAFKWIPAAWNTHAAVKL